MTATPELSRPSTNTDLRPYLAKVDGRTVREVLIDGYESANLVLRRELVLRSDNLVRLIERGAMLPAENAGEEDGSPSRTEVAQLIFSD